MQKAIGIDLGTTNTVVAVLLDGRPQVLEDDRGYRVLPSVVTLDGLGAEVVGHAARNRILTDPDKTVYAIKRLMGRRYDSEQVTDARQRVGYQIEAAPDGSCLVVAGGRRLSPVEVSAMILRTAREMAERALGQPVQEAVITVPAYFNHQQRNATLEAAQLAGLRCERLVNEPTAAALAYGYRKDVDRTLLIYDLGGGTFDVSVLHLSGGVYEILSTRGDTFLGGEDFDYRLVDYLADHFQTQTGHDLRSDRMALQRIKDAAERAKCELSFTDKTTVLVPRLARDKSLEVAITRLTLESLVEDLVERSVEVTRKAVADAGLNLADIDDVILVGGQTRMPRIREAISGLFGKEPSRGVHPEEVVAIGAAVHAASILEAGSGPSHVLIDVTPFDLGIDVAGGLFQTVVARNSHVPTSDTRVFATTRDDQDSVRITVRQGDSRFADENEFLGEFTMEGLTRALRMETKVEVTFRIDSNGMLHVSAVEPGTSEARRITVRNYAEVAGAKGAVKAVVEGEARTAGEGGAPAPVAVGSGAAPARDKKAAAAKGGFFSGLLGGRKKQATPPAPPKGEAPAVTVGGAPAAPPASPAVASTPTLAPVEALGAAAAGAAVAASSAGMGRIHLPAAQPIPDADAVDFDALDSADLHAEPLEDEDELPSAAAVGLAGAPGDAWDSPEDGFEMPADEEDEDHVPVGLAGGAYEDLADDDVFALPETSGLEAGASGRPAEGGRSTVVPVAEADEEEILGMDDEAFGDLAEETFAELGVDPFADLGPEALEDFGEESAPTSLRGPGKATAVRPGPAQDEDLFGDLEGEDLDHLASELFDLPGPGAPVAAADPARRTAVPLDEPDTSELFEFTTSASSAAPARGATVGERAEEPLFLPPPALSAKSDELHADDLFGAADDLDEREGLDGEDRLFSLPAGLSDRSAARHDNDEQTEIFARSPGPASRGGASALGGAAGARRRRRKPARLKLAYRQVDAMIAEYRENLRRGGCFVKTGKPLPVGRECVIEVRAPGMDEPLSIDGVVTWSSVGLSTLPAGQDPGMGIEYRLDDHRRAEVERILSSLAG